MDRILYYLSASTEQARVAAALEHAARDLSPFGRHVHLSYESSLERSLARLRSGGIDALVVDGRMGHHREAAQLLSALFDGTLSGPIARQRTWLVVEPNEFGTHLAFRAGQLRLAGAIAAETEQQLWPLLWRRIATAAAKSRSGKIALCLAGGGTEGLLYELGVLRALQRFLPAFELSNVDMICGISAGAILGALLANRLPPDAISEGLRGRDPRLEPIGRSDLFDLNLRGLLRQASRLGREVLLGKRSPMSALFRLPPAGLFEGRRLERWIERQLNRDHMCNDFASLNCDLFIGATDMDSTEHVVFGMPGAPTVPIHQAVRASTALAPFYAPAQLGGRYYIDGAFSRTTNTRVAVDQGATMLILVEPLIPFRSPRAGHVAERGAIYGAAQGLKSLISGRFTKALSTLRAMYPDVAIHLFQPSGTALRMLSGSPMKFWYREEVEQIAFEETMREIRTHRALALARDFERHAVRFVDPDTASIARGAMLESFPNVA